MVGEVSIVRAVDSSNETSRKTMIDEFAPRLVPF